MNRDEWIRLILEACPGFKRHWEDHLAFWGDQTPGITNDMDPLINYCEERITERDSEQVAAICRLIEASLEDGDTDLQYGAELGFLEGITNRLLGKKERDDARTFATHLLPKAKAFCIELDGFWGTNTPGLKD